MNRLESAQRALKRIEQIEQTVRYRRERCEQLEREIQNLNAELSEARESLRSAIAESDQSEDLKIALRGTIARLQKTDEARKIAIRTRDAMLALGLPVPDKLRELCE